MNECILPAPLEKCGWPRRLQQRLPLPRDVRPADHDQVREFLFLDAAIQHSRVRRPRTETPRLLAERKKESVAFVMIVEFVDLYRRLRHAGQAWFDKWFARLPDCAAAWRQRSCCLCRQQHPRMASYQRRRLERPVSGREQGSANFRRRMPDGFFRDDQDQPRFTRRRISSGYLHPSRADGFNFKIGREVPPYLQFMFRL